MNDELSEDPVPLPIAGELDLHTFRPDEIASLLDAYFTECVKRGIFHVRVIHGKGTGTLRATVHHQLRRSPHVVNFRVADQPEGGWGATWVDLVRRG